MNFYFMSENFQRKDEGIFAINKKENKFLFHIFLIIIFFFIGHLTCRSTTKAIIGRYTGHDTSISAVMLEHMT